MTAKPLTVGVVTPHAAPGPEVELPAMMGGRLTTVVCRTASHAKASQASAPPGQKELRASTEQAALDDAEATFKGSTLTVVTHASTTAGFVIGRRGEDALVERLTQRFRVPAVVSCAAAVGAARMYGIKRIQLVHPPWFANEFDALGAAYFRSHGFSASVTKAADLPEDPASVEPQHVIDWVQRNMEDRAEAVFLAGNGFRTADAVEELERRTGRLIIGANHALLWGILTATSWPLNIRGYGRLLLSSHALT